MTLRRAVRHIRLRPAATAKVVAAQVTAALTGLKLPTIMLLVLVLLGSIGTVTALRSMTFDDAYITYRYADNLANGHGITWNLGEAPTEGYTNFLLVLLLAPCIALGWDPLLVTRILGGLAALAIGIALFRIAREEHGADGNTATLIAAALPVATPTVALVMLGLETVLFTAALFYAFLAGSRYLRSGHKADGIRAGVLLLLAFLLRPEAVWLLLALVAMFLVSPAPARPRWHVLYLLGLAFGLPLAIYLIWKTGQFGDLFPNPYYVKVAAPGGFSRLGLESIITLLRAQWPLLLAAGLTLFLGNVNRRARALAALCCLLYLVFIARVDTLMDFDGRFLYPITPLLLYLAMPALLVGLRRLRAVRCSSVPQAVLITFALVLFLNPGFLTTLARQYRYLAQRYDPWADTRNLMAVEYRMARALQTYPGIADISIACCDAGMIPYFTRAAHLDTVGLNNSYIAKKRNLSRLVDYYFNWEPTLAITCATKANGWVANGHGPLGDFTRWSGDPRWDHYAYIGTVTTDPGYYNLHLFLHRDTPDFARFTQFIQTHVADRILDPFPLAIGGYVPPATTAPAEGR